MAIRDLITRSGKKSVPIKSAQGDPFGSLHQEIDRVFENFSRGFFDLSPFSSGLLDPQSGAGFDPKIDIKENEKEIEVTAELPGMEEKDVQLTLTDHELVLSGEKKSEKEEKGKEWYRMERSYGSFHRTIPLPANVDGTKADATFKKGILSVTLPKRPGSRSDSKKITIHHA